MFWQQLANGFSLGGVYALIAVGYSLVYSILELINFTHGQVYMLGAYVTVALMVAGANLFVAVLGGALFCALLGTTVERVAYRPIRGRARITLTLSAIAVSFILENLLLVIWGGHYRVFPKSQLVEILSRPFSISGVIVFPLQYFVLVVSLLGMLILHLTLRYTKLGMAIRCVAEDIPIAKLMGIKADQIIAIVFSAGSILAAVSGVLVGMYLGLIYPGMAYPATMKAFTACILGGIGSVPGALLGGLILGVSESLVAAYLTTEYREAVVFIFLIAVLLLRPSGILGRKIARKGI